MNFYDSYKEARRAYWSASKLSRSWISKYYCKSDINSLHLPIERIQSFSQLYFFSCMIESEIIKKKTKIDYKIQNIWHQYPNLEIGIKDRRYKQFLHTLKLLFFRSSDLIISLLGPQIKSKFEDKKFDVVFVGSRRHLDEISESIIVLSKRFKVLVIGKIDTETKVKFNNGNVDFLDVPSGSMFLKRRDRINTVLKFLLTSWNLQSPVKDKDVYGFFKSREWRSRLWYLRLMIFPEIVALYKLAIKILSTTKPAIVITTSSNDTFGASFSLAALEQKIKVAELQHGFFKMWDYEWEFCNCNYFLVWGEESKRVKRSLVSRMHTIGLPFFNNRFKSKLTSKKLLKNKTALFLWCPAYGSASLYKSELASETFSNIIKAFSKFPQTWRITIRTHPSYALSDELRGLKIPTNIKISNWEPIELAIDNHDVIITQATTAGLIAIIKGKPLFFFDNTWLNRKLGNPYVRSGSALNIPEGSLDKLYNYVSNFLNNKEMILNQRKSQRKFVKQAIYKIGKGSSFEIEKFVNMIISKQHTV